MSLTVNSNVPTPATPTTMQVPGAGMPVQGESAEKITADASTVILGGMNVSLLDTSAVGGTGNVRRADSAKKVVSLDEIPELDADSVKDILAVVEDLEKLIAELKEDSTEEQIAQTKERIATLKNKLSTEHRDRLSKIEDTMEKLDDAARQKQLQEAMSWTSIAMAIVAVVVAVAVAVAATLTAGAALGIAVAVVAWIGAASSAASAGLQIYQQAAKDDLAQQVKDKAAEYRSQGMKSSEAWKQATEDVNGKFMTASMILAGVSTVCGIFTGFAGGGLSGALGIVQMCTSGAGMATGGLNIWVSKEAADANYDAQSSQAELAHLESVLQRLQKALEENSEEIQKLVQALMQALADLAALLESAVGTMDEISQQTGATA